MTLTDIITTRGSFASEAPVPMTVTLAPHGGPRPGGNARQRRRLRRWLARVSVVCENATLRIENLTGEKVTVIVTGRGR